MVIFIPWVPNMLKLTTYKQIPICSMYGIFAYIYHKHQLNVGGKIYPFVPWILREWKQIQGLMGFNHQTMFCNIGMSPNLVVNADFQREKKPSYTLSFRKIMFISIDTFFYAKSTTRDPGEVPQNSIPTKELRRAVGNIHQAISPCEQGGYFSPNLGKQSIHGRSGYENKNHSNHIPFLRQFNPNM